MKRYLLTIKAISIFFVLLLMFSCGSNNKKLLFSTKICQGIYVEKYLVFSWGAYSTEVYSEYLTDSANFRIYVGKHDEDIKYYYHCAKDSIWVIKLAGNKDNVLKIIDTVAVYNLNVLKSKKGH